MRRTPWIAVIAAALALPAVGANERRQQSAAVREALTSAEAARAAGDLADAADGFGRALALAEGLGPRSLYLARAADGLADVHRQTGRLDDAVELYLRAIPLWETLLGPRQPRLAVSLHNLGTVYVALGRPQDARPVLERALAIWTIAYGGDSDAARNTARALGRLP